MQVFDGKVTDGDPNTCGHVITTTAGSGSNKQTLTYHTQRVVGNGSFGVVFQATCVETGDTVCFSSRGMLNVVGRHWPVGSPALKATSLLHEGERAEGPMAPEFQHKLHGCSNLQIAML